MLYDVLTRLFRDGWGQESPTNRSYGKAAVRTFLFTFSLLILSGSSVRGVSWYVDNAASGANNGSSWANAWNSLAAINWNGVNPGDTIYISGGSTAKSYRPNSLTIGKSGTSAAPITIRPGQEVGHNGNVLLQALSWGAHQWVTVDGAKGSPTPPADVAQVESRGFVNSIGFWMENPNGTGAYMSAPVGNQMLWCAVTNVVRGTATLAHGLWANVSQPTRTTNNVIRYNLISHTEDDGIAWVGNLPATSHGEVDISFNIIEYVGDDGLEANHGFAVHDNIIGPCIQLHGHPDGIQSVGSYFKVYNNKFYDFLNAFLRMQAAQAVHSDILIFNNTFISGVPYPEPMSPLVNTGIEIVQYANGIGELPLMVWSNVVVANNTFYTTNSSQTGATIGWGKRSETTANAFVHNVVLTNCLVANNLSYVRNPLVEIGTSIGVGWQPWRTSAPYGTSPTYSTERDVVFDWNTAAGTHPGVRKVSYFGTNHASGEAMALVSRWKQNRSTVPVFVQEGVNFDLASNDTAARNIGTNLSHLFNFDILNRPRNVGGAWDRGAFESGQSIVTAPSAFALVSPASGATDQVPTPTLNWGASGGAVTYQIEVDSEAGFSASLIHSGTSSGTTYALPAGVLSAGTTYFWRVRAVNSAGSVVAGNAPFSLVTSSTSTPVKPVPPSNARFVSGPFSLTTPANGATGVASSPTLAWTDAFGEASYTVEIDSEPGFTAPLVHSENLNANTITYEVPAGTLANGTTYYWRVRSVDAGGATVTPANGPFSMTIANTVVAPPGAFSLSSPTSNVGDIPLEPTLTWTDASGEASYLVEVDTEAGFTPPLVHQAEVAANTVSLPLPAGVLAGSSQYYWRVRARNTGGEVFGAGSPRGFYTAVSSGGGGGGAGETNGPLVWLAFEDDFGDSTLSDSSGNGNHGHRFGRPGSVVPTNFPIRVAASATGGINGSAYAGDFYWNTNSDYGFYAKDGNYAAITNVQAFTNLSRMTIAVRAHYSSAGRIDPSYNYSADGNATLVSAGTSSALLGSWDVQRFNQAIWLNNTRFMVVTNSNFGIAQVGSASDPVFGKAGRAVFNFPDRGYDNNGDTTNWHHYAVTFNAGVVVTYFDGVPLVTNDLSAAVTTLTVGMNPSVSAATGFIGIGCNTHGGTPALEDETGEDYPNHGWFNGQIDDVMMFNRALSAAEIQGIAAGH